MTISEKRKTLILAELRELKVSNSVTIERIYQNIINWQRKSDNEIELWYNKFFK